MKHAPPPEMKNAAPAGTGNGAMNSKTSHLTLAYSDQAGSVKHTPPATGDKAMAYKAAHFCPALTPAARQVLAVLVDAANAKTGRCNPSVAEIGRRLGGMGARTIMGATALLEAADPAQGRPSLIKKRRTRGSSYFDIDWQTMREVVDAYDRGVLTNTDSEGGDAERRNSGVKTCKKVQIRPEEICRSDLQKAADGTHLIEPIKLNPLSPQSPSPRKATAAGEPEIESTKEAERIEVAERIGRQRELAARSPESKARVAARAEQTIAMLANTWKVGDGDEAA